MELTVDKISRYTLGLKGDSRVEVYGEFVTDYVYNYPEKPPHQILYISHICSCLCLFHPKNPKPNTKNITHFYVRVAQNICNV